MGGKALFLDRDGVINVDHGFVHRHEDFDFIDGVFESCRSAISHGYGLVVVTNQSGIGRGLFTLDEYLALTTWMETRFCAEGAELTAVYYGPTHPVQGQGRHRRISEERKPAAGMLLKARDELGLDLAHSVLVGDKETDIAAGLAATVRMAGTDAAPVTNADFVAPKLAGAIDWLIAAAV